MTGVDAESSPSPPAHHHLFNAARSPLLRFIALYVTMFSAFGVTSPFLPGLLQQDGLSPTLIGLVLAAGTTTRLVAGPVGGRLADWSGRPAMVLSGCIAAAALCALGYAPARGLFPLLLVSVVNAAVQAPMTPLADALALGSAQGTRPGKRGFEYGWVRGAGSAAFIAGTLIAGQVVGATGLISIIWLGAALLGIAAGFAATIPNQVTGAPAPESPLPASAIRTLLGIPMFRRLMAVTALIGGSHALHDAFAVIRWREAGLSSLQASELWAISVAAEVAVFLFLGRHLLDRLGPGPAMMLAGTAGIVRWSISAVTAWFPLMLFVEPLHGLTFALLHLACMDMISRVVPAGLAATGQAFYGNVAMQVIYALVTLASGALYGQFGAAAFWAMAAMCAVAIPLAAGIRLPAAPA